MKIIKDGYVVDTDPWEGELVEEPCDHIAMFVGRATVYKGIDLEPDHRGYIYIKIGSEIYTAAGCKDGDLYQDARTKIWNYLQEFDTLGSKPGDEGGL